MFADIAAAYYRRVISLYLNEDGSSGCCDSGEGYASCGSGGSGGSGADEYLFNASGDEEMPPPFAALPPLFSYC